MDKLDYVEPDKYFWFVTGDCAKSLKELSDKIKILDSESFRFHVNKEKNDFIPWIKTVIDDDVLVKRLESKQSKKDMISIIDKRISELKRDVSLELPSLTNHLKQRRVNQIKEFLEDINYKIIHHSDILDKYERVRDLYKKLDKEHKRKVYSDIVKTYNKMQEIWSRINY